MLDEGPLLNLLVSCYALEQTVAATLTAPSAR